MKKVYLYLIINFIKKMNKEYSPEYNFDKYLWNKYDVLHDKLIKKLAYLSNVLNNFNDIYKVKEESYTKINKYSKKHK